MSEVTKITVTFDDGTEHVVFQVGKVVDGPAATPTSSTQLARVRVALDQVLERLPGSTPVPVPPMPASCSVAEYTASLFDHYAQDFLFRNVDSTPLPKRAFNEFSVWVDQYLSMLKDPTYWNNISSEPILLPDVNEESWANFEYGVDHKAIAQVEQMHGKLAECHAFTVGRDNYRLDEMKERLYDMHDEYGALEFEWIPDYCLTVILDPTKTIPLLWTIHED